MTNCPECCDRSSINPRYDDELTVFSRQHDKKLTNSLFYLFLGLFFQSLRPFLFFHVAAFCEAFMEKDDVRLSDLDGLIGLVSINVGDGENLIVLQL